MKCLLFLTILLSSLTASAAHVVSKQANIDLDTQKVVHVSGYIGKDLAISIGEEVKNTYGMPGDRLVIINSPGGSVDYGKVILGILLAEKYTTGNRLVCIVDKNAHSMGFNILSYCDVRLATADAHMLVHKIAISGIDDGRTRWTPKNLRKLADDMEAEDEQFRQKNASMMHMSLKEYDMLADIETMCSADSLLLRHYLSGIARLEK